MKSNPEKGTEFRKIARLILERELGVRLDEEVPLSIGSPAKQHRFDLASADCKWIIECKNLAWRAGGKRPEAKLTSVTEAATVLRLLAFGV